VFGAFDRRRLLRFAGECLIHLGMAMGLVSPLLLWYREPGADADTDETMQVYVPAMPLAAWELVAWREMTRSLSTGASSPDGAEHR
jgi:hypothetical protein